jgi:SARP family transcriptional regulator, regulator of embCAB operon
MMVRGPRLRSLSPEGQKETYELNLAVVKIGRSKDNDLAFPSEMTISGHHCEIVREGKNFYIRDLSSTNGVVVNKQKVASSLLSEADEIRLGDKIFTFTFLG